MKYVYACITFKCHKDMEEVKKTMKYKKAVDIATALRVDDIIIDVCTSRNRNKHNLERILSTTGNVVIVSDISSLGQKEELAAVYQRIIESQNDILICYFGAGGILKAEELSTVSLSYEKKEPRPMSVVREMLDMISSTRFRKESTRVVDPRIIEAYWDIEKGKKTQNAVVGELGTSKSTFGRRVEEYVGSDDWYDRYSQELEMQGSTLKDIPTKLGDISDDAKKLYEYLEAKDENGNYIHKQELVNYPLEVVASFARVDSDMLEQIESLPLNASKERDRLSDRYDVIAHHTYRQYLRYCKYIKRLEYRSK